MVTKHTKTTNIVVKGTVVVVANTETIAKHILVLGRAYKCNATYAKKKSNCS